MCFYRVCSKQKGYKCYNPQTGRIHVNMNVSFLENQPYFHKNSLQGEKDKEEEFFWDFSTVTLPTSIISNSHFLSDFQNKEKNVQENGNDGSPCQPMPNLDVS